MTEHKHPDFCEDEYTCSYTDFKKNFKYFLHYLTKFEGMQKVYSNSLLQN